MQGVLAQEKEGAFVRSGGQGVWRINYGILDKAEVGSRAFYRQRESACDRPSHSMIGHAGVV